MVYPPTRRANVVHLSVITSQSSSLMASESFVYLEDIESKKPAKPSPPPESSNDDDLKTVTSGSVSNSQSTGTSQETGKKRQLNITDMFGSQPTSSSAPMAKKLKLTSSAPAGSSKSGQLRLNAIPFSLSQFQDSLNDDQRGLLSLECALMGKSWYALLSIACRHVSIQCANPGSSF